MAEGISLGELSRRIGLDKGGLSRKAKTGRIPRNADGTYDEEAVRIALKSNRDPGRAKPLLGDVDAPSTVNAKDEAREAVARVKEILAEEGQDAASGFDAARTAETILKVRERDLKLAKAREELIDKSRAISAAYAFNRMARDAWLRWPARYAALMASDLEIDPHALETVLEQYVREHIDEIADAKFEIV